MFDIEKDFKLARGFLPGGLDDFLGYLGVTKDDLLCLDPASLMQIPFVQSRQLYVSREQEFQADCLNHRVEIRSHNGDSHLYAGRGNDHQEAVIRGLMLYWEIDSRRNLKKTE